MQIKKEVIGHMNCPVCLFKDGLVKEDKNKDAFFFCPDCATQIFTRNAHRDHHMRGRMRPVTVTVTDNTDTEPSDQTVTEPIQNTPPAKPKGKAGKPAPARPKKAAPLVPDAPKKSSWFQPILGSAK